MRLRCLVCGNQGKFTAEAKANINVVINNKGELISQGTSMSPNLAKDVVILRPWKCNSCGAADRIEDLDKKKGTTEDATGRETAEN